MLICNGRLNSWAEDYTTAPTLPLMEDLVHTRKTITKVFMAVLAAGAFAACGDNGDPASVSAGICDGKNVCIEAGEFCGDGHIATCAEDADGCLVYAITESCNGGNCIDGATAPECVCADDPGCLADGFSFCEGDAVVTCATGADGCLDATSAACEVTMAEEGEGKVPACDSLGIPECTFACLPDEELPDGVESCDGPAPEPDPIQLGSFGPGSVVSDAVRSAPMTMGDTHTYEITFDADIILAGTLEANSVGNFDFLIGAGGFSSTNLGNELFERAITAGTYTITITKVDDAVGAGYSLKMRTMAP